jgi:ATP-binding cassette subfamily B protein/ATP-binding cassette subfamily C protein/ATP-binding cassette subfamily B multidrug efflux pump
VSIAPGQTLGIVGPTGAGKSSIIKLLLRQIETAHGQVRWGEHAIAEYPLHSLRTAINWVAQEPFLFSASVAENIALSNPYASREQVIRAATLAAVHDDILRFPQGYDTPVGERGVTLSGGQRQRVAIARALLTSSPLLILDDALSAVDTDTETRILQHLAELRKTKRTQCDHHQSPPECGGRCRSHPCFAGWKNHRTRNASTTAGRQSMVRIAMALSATGGKLTCRVI